MGALVQGVMAAALVVMMANSFNIDTSKPDIIQGNADAYFGYRVLQFGAGSNPGIIVSAPLERNGSRNITGAIYKCDSQSQACEPIPIP
uniref:integrin alpha-11-like n=1 Tax=Pristiophorus japonicus TaxID=55135 RepID=UPI00398EE7F8